LRVFLPTIDIRDIGLDGVRSYQFITSLYVDCRIGRLKTFAKDSIEGHPCILGGDLESLLDDVSWKPGKMRMKGIVITWCLQYLARSMVTWTSICLLVHEHDLAFVAMPSKGSTSASKATPGWCGRGCLGDTGDRIACFQDQLLVINGKTHPDVPRILQKFGPRFIRYMCTIAVVCQHSIMGINPYSVNTGINVVLFLIIGF
jgi:hypothetical protein